MTESIIYKRDHQVAMITFNRPEQLNAFNREMAFHLEKICLEVKNDPTIRAVLLKGQGEAFVAGNDLQEMYNNFDRLDAEALSLIRHFNNSTLALREMNQPVLAMVHGLCTGAGMSLLLAADLAVASNDARFAMGFNKIATSPAGGITYHLPKVTGTKKAMELMLLSEVITADAAEACGLINWSVPATELQHKTDFVLDRLITGPSIAFGETKKLVNAAWHNKIVTQLELEAEAFAKCVSSRDFKTAVRAFVNKRIPEFEGR